MLSEEEKKAINIIKSIEKQFYENKQETNLSCYDDMIIAIRTILKLVNKLEKEDKEKDKQIDLMAKKIYDAYFEQVDFWIWFETAIEKNLEKDYCESIKQYVKKQVKEEGN